MSRKDLFDSSTNFHGSQMFAVLRVLSVVKTRRLIKQMTHELSRAFLEILSTRNGVFDAESELLNTFRESTEKRRFVHGQRDTSHHSSS